MMSCSSRSMPLSASKLMHSHIRARWCRNRVLFSIHQRCTPFAEGMKQYLLAWNEFALEEQAIVLRRRSRYSTRIPQVSDGMGIKLSRQLTSVIVPLPLSFLLSAFFAALSVSSFVAERAPSSSDLSSAACPFVKVLPFALTATSFGLKSLSGSKVSLRRADLRRFACGSLMESSEPARRERFGRRE
jgi:hypothetical protein